MPPKAKARKKPAADSGQKTPADKAPSSPPSTNAPDAASVGGIYSASSLEQLAPLHRRGFVVIAIAAFTLLYGADSVGKAAESGFLWSRGDQDAAKFVTLALQSLALYALVGATAWLIAARVLWPSAKRKQASS